MTDAIETREITSLLDEQHKVIIDWSPKAGCTILVKMFLKNMGLLEQAMQYNSWVHEYRMHVFTKEHPISMEDLRNTEYYKIKFVRNPYHRAVSSYMHTMKYESMNEPVRKKLWRWNADISFKSFIRYLSKIDLHTCDPHYALQKKWFEVEIPDCFNEFIKLNTLSEAITSLNLRKGFHFDLSGLSSGHHHVKNQELSENVSNLKWSRFQNNIPPYSNFYTAELADKVHSLYKEDFDLYGFSKNDYLM